MFKYSAAVVEGVARNRPQAMQGARMHNCRAGRLDGARYSFGNRIANAGSAVNMHRALCPHSEITVTVCLAPYF